jgi:hypothetical protein
LLTETTLRDEDVRSHSHLGLNFIIPGKAGDIEFAVRSGSATDAEAGEVKLETWVGPESSNADLGCPLAAYFHG